MPTTRDGYYTAIDVGTTKIITLVARIGASGALEVAAVGRASSEGMRKGQVVSEADLAASVRTSAGYAQEMLGRPLPAALVGITGTHLTFATGQSAFSKRGYFGGSPVTDDDVNSLMRGAGANHQPGKRLVHVIPRHYQINGLRGVRNPVGNKADELSASAHVVYGDSEAIARVARVVRAAGVPVRGLVMEHLASAEAVLTADERELGVVLVDIGGGTTDIAVYRDGAVIATSCVPVAGNHFTTDIGLALGVGPAAAESTKIHFGSAFVAGTGATGSVNVDTGMAGHTRPVSRLQINQILHDRSVELARLVLLKLREAGLDRVPQGGIVLTGGSANLQGLADVFRDYGKCAVRVGAPSAAFGLPQELRDPALSTAVGLLVWGVRYHYAGAIAPDIVIKAPLWQRLRHWFVTWLQHRPQHAGRPARATR